MEGVIWSNNLALEPFWHAVLPSENLRDGTVAVELLGRRLALARLSGETTALDDVCRHLGAALSSGNLVDGGTRRCHRRPAILPRARPVEASASIERALVGRCGTGCPTGPCFGRSR
jgi:hypothetical protein